MFGVDEQTLDYLELTRRDEEHIELVREYLDASGLLPYLEDLGYNVVGYGCTTCIGNAGPLPDSIERAIDAEDLWTTSVLSGNRNFEARIHPKVQANYLASPPLVVAYGLAGRMDIDLEHDPLGTDNDGKFVEPCPCDRLISVDANTVR